MTMLGAVSIFENMKLPLGPIVDGDILPEPPYILRAQSPPRPVLCGNCAHEGLVFCKFYYLKTTSLYIF